MSAAAAAAPAPAARLAGGAALDRVRGWFAEQGWAPFPFQEETWSRYLAGESGMIHAATGTGKTYAAWMGPLAEALTERVDAPEIARKPEVRREAGSPTLPLSPSPPRSARRPRLSVRERAQPLTVLWITPLRALANDLVGALRAPLAPLGLEHWIVEARTGDTSGALKSKQRDRPPTALVTTPESLSLLLSYPDARERLSTLRCVVVDEWHELMGSKRGAQLELALARLRLWNPELRTWGLSATLQNLEEAARTLVGVTTLAASAPPARAGNPLDGAPPWQPGPPVPAPAVISGEVPKPYVVDTIVPAQITRFPWAGHLGLRLLPEVLDAIESARSTLLFTNVRSQAESWYQAIVAFRPDWAEQVALHHGSIDRKIRQQVEEGLRQGKLKCVVCTSSLDLGVDFTPVDQVIQIGSPKGIARLLQRAGRSGHRPGEESRVLCVPTHAFELVEFAAARAAMDERAVEPRRPLDRPLDVLVQHLVTVALAGGFHERELYDEVRTTLAFQRLSLQEWRWALDFVTRGGPALRAYPQYARLVEQDGWFHVASAQIARLHRLSIGTITGDPVVQLQFLRGKKLGTVEESFIARLRPGERFVFAGRVLKLVRMRDMTALVKLASGGKGEIPRWYGARLSFSTQLGEAV
ncbi:MAG TPA: DEAD/DEAH box helicase, partial [Longimicrobiales bacterium]